MLRVGAELLYGDDYSGRGTAELIGGIQGVSSGLRRSDDYTGAADGADLRRDDVLGGASGLPGESDCRSGGDRIGSAGGEAGNVWSGALRDVGGSVDGAQGDDFKI